MQRIAFHVNSDKPEADGARARLASLARAIGLDVLDDARASECDAVIVLGGDGTMLSAVTRSPASGSVHQPSQTCPDHFGVGRFPYASPTA